jgi:Trm5-related predicted tRNA methylase
MSTKPSAVDATELHVALKDAQAAAASVARQLAPLIEKTGRRSGADELVAVARDAEELAEMLQEAAADLRGTARQIQAHLDR